VGMMAELGRRMAQAGSLIAEPEGKMTEVVGRAAEFAPKYHILHRQ
jgi:hypothetical protein